jgi:hypothetical protein
MSVKNAPPIIAEDDDCLWVTHEDMLDHLKEAHGLSLEKFHELEPHHVKDKEAFLETWREELNYEHDNLHEDEPLLKPAHRKPLRICGWRPLHEQAEEEEEENTQADELYIVRLFDMFDGWIDVSDPVTKVEAFRLWNEHTNNGTYRTKYEDGDYYAVFPANTRMLVTPESLGR